MANRVEVGVDLKDGVSAPARRMSKSFSKSTNAMSTSATTANNSFSGMGTSIKGVATGLVGLAAAGAALKIGKDAMRANREFETLSLTFKTVLGNATDAKKRMEELAKFAASTPFQLPQIAKASKTLETLTEGALSTGEGLRMVGDSAAVAGVPMEELAVHVGRAMDALSNNRPAGEAISRMQELGLISGKTRNQIEQLQKQARGVEAWDVLQESLSKNTGAMSDLADTFDGKLSTLGDKVDEFYRKLIDDSSFSFWKDRIDNLITLTETFTDVLGDNLTEMDKLTQKANKSTNETLMLQQHKISLAEEELRVLESQKKIKKEQPVLDERIIKKKQQIASLEVGATNLAKHKNALDEKDNKNKEEKIEKTTNLTAIKQKEVEVDRAALDVSQSQLDNFVAMQAAKDEAAAKDAERTEQFIAQQEQRSSAEGAAAASSQAYTNAKINNEEAETAKTKKEIKERDAATVSSMNFIARSKGSSNKILDGMGRAAAVGNITRNTYEAASLALAKIPMPFGAIAAAGVTATGLGLAADAAGVKAFAEGGEFTTNGPQLIQVGDNSGGAERVSIEPLSSPNINGPKGGGSSVINISIGTVDTPERANDVAMAVQNALRNNELELFTESGQKVIS